MEGKQHIYYALGEVAYAVAKSDGEVQSEERSKIHDIVLAETAHHSVDFDVAEIIFHILKKDDTKPETAYEWAMKQFKDHSKYLTADLVIDFVAVVEKVAVAFNAYEKTEKALVERFRKDLRALVNL